ncbi:hypothetical protein NKH18_45120 [Streptomyces sp. M10(2022)]
MRGDPLPASDAELTPLQHLQWLLLNSHEPLSGHEADDSGILDGILAGVVARELGTHLVLRYPDDRIAEFGADSDQTVSLVIGMVGEQAGAQ